VYREDGYIANLVGRFLRSDLESRSNGEFRGLSDASNIRYRGAMSKRVIDIVGPNLDAIFDAREDRLGAFVLISTILLICRTSFFLLIVCRELFQTRFPPKRCVLSSRLCYIFSCFFIFSPNLKAANME